MNSNIFYVTTLGELTISYRGRCVFDKNNRSKKPWNFIAYMIMNRDRELKSSELVSLIWDEYCENNTTGALKVLLHRVRMYLDPLSDEPDFDPIHFRKGTFKWSYPEITKTDYEEFEEILAKANDTSLDTAARIKAYESALELYKGDFLAKNPSTWASNFRDHFHNLFMSAAYALIDLYYESNNYAAVIAVCEKGLIIEKNDDKLYYHLINSLYKSGKQKRALDKYNETTATFYRKFGITPSDDLKALYRQIIQTSNTTESNIGLIQAELKEDSLKKGAFFCEYGIFKDIYRITERACQRSGDSAFLCLFTLVSTVDDTVIPSDLKHFNKAMDELSNAINGALRKGDIYSRYSVSQFVILLTGLTFENASTIISRISQVFNHLHPGKDVTIDYKMLPIDISIS